ncbi:type I restriction enzyme HsdR N-terminal domain-containing protein [Ancylobacter pratisalsi]|uniref:Type I restriction enzyme R protein N-terminal domain-containing protein n=1 Tax=Ancylobacter pratisalsi TaxID=1745854 RepID=A0A6P1YPK6_9HYPH|nr:type I restriction enzyme HsdR N-terminal domain-containing protein [Ancylobacter pratisalsi]QIB35005.1 hypothetical protein G3A50_15775 [Ancylobacter pratisalsi]
MTTREEFRASLISFGERALKVRDHLKNEEATKVALILPFIALLGYDDRDPVEVAAEHAADFSEKYRNRVDYAILRNMEPIIAVECKGAGNGKKDDRGQLKSYFNACRTVKLGVLSDGYCYEFFVDSEEPNLMDDEPFLSLHAEELAKGRISESVLDALFGLTKVHFDPETIGDNARKSLTQRAFSDYLTAQFQEPSVEFTRFLLKENAIKHVRTQAIDAYRNIAKSAIDDVVTSNILRKLDIKDRQVAAPSPLMSQPAPPTPAQVRIEPETTAGELAAFENVRRRLAFLSAGDANLFERIDRIRYRDYQGKMAVFYELERKGRLLDICESKDGVVRYVFFDDEKGPVVDLASADARLIGLFRRRVDELSAE